MAFFYAGYNDPAFATYNASAQAIFGRRHTGGGGGLLNGFINEARIYDSTLSAGDIGELFALGPDQVEPGAASGTPEPSALLLATLGLLGLGLCTRRKRNRGLARTSAMALVCMSLVCLNAPANAALVGQWTFEPGSEFVDTQGNFPNVGLKGNASVSGGALDVNGTGTSSTGWAVTEGGVYTGPAIVDKTLVSWVTMESLAPPFAGSAITIDRTSGDHFDGIIFGERQTNRWMNGSSGFSRTQDFVPGFQETVTGQLVQMAITYDDADNVPGGTMTITGYRNGVQIGQYNTGNGSSWSAGDAEVFFGLRHGSTGGGPGGIDALIEEGRIYNEVLTQQQISELEFVTPGSGATGTPEPSTFALLLIALTGVGFCGRRRRPRV